MIDRATPRHMRAVVTLVFLSPVIAEVLYGSTHLTTLFLLIPQMAVYGCAALIIREVVRRRGGGWPSILLLGIAFSIAEECLILQTSLAPLFFAADPFMSTAAHSESTGHTSLGARLRKRLEHRDSDPGHRDDLSRSSQGSLAREEGIFAGIRHLYRRIHFRLVHLAQVAMKQYYHGPPFHIALITIVIAALMSRPERLAFIVPRQEDPGLRQSELPCGWS